MGKGRCLRVPNDDGFHEFFNCLLTVITHSVIDRVVAAREFVLRDPEIAVGLQYPLVNDRAHKALCLHPMRNESMDHTLDTAAQRRRDDA